MMKKATTKLVIRSETLRALAQLDLVRVAGGAAQLALAGTGGPETGCPLALVMDTGDGSRCVVALVLVGKA